MKITLVLVEDESVTLDNLKQLIERYFPYIKIAACARNGEDGLRMARQFLPDLLVTDIRMPVMDGLELIRRLQEQLPEVKSLILSGHQDFAYAKSAIQFGACDYLLKPLSPSTLRETFDRVLPIVREQIRKKRAAIVREMAIGKEFTHQELLKYFPYVKYCVAITRKNGLPNRLHLSNLTDSFSGEGEVIDLCGRDEMESINICPADALTIPQLVAFSRKPYCDVAGYDTTVAWHQSVSIEKMSKLIKLLFQSLDNSVTVGYTQTQMVKGLWEQPYKHQQLSRDIVRHMQQYAGAYDVYKASSLILDFLSECDKKKYPQIWVQESVKLLIRQFYVYVNQDLWDQSMEQMITDAFYYSVSMEDLKENLKDAFYKLKPKEYMVDMKMDSQEFFEDIRVYIDNHLSESLTVPALCKVFGISQSHLSRLFQKYMGLTFTRYLTVSRIERAKTLLQKKELLIRDVAKAVGFSDQFYFSRLFHTTTGISPSDYLNQ